MQFLSYIIIISIAGSMMPMLAAMYSRSHSNSMPSVCICFRQHCIFTYMPKIEQRTHTHTHKQYPTVDWFGYKLPSMQMPVISCVCVCVSVGGMWALSLWTRAPANFNRCTCVTCAVYTARVAYNTFIRIYVLYSICMPYVRSIFVYGRGT